MDRIAISDSSLNSLAQALISLAIAITLARLPRKSAATRYYTLAFFCVSFMFWSQFFQAVVTASSLRIAGSALFILFYVGAFANIIQFAHHYPHLAHPRQARIAWRVCIGLTIGLPLISILLASQAPAQIPVLFDTTVKALVLVWALSLLLRRTVELSAQNRVQSFWNAAMTPVGRDARVLQVIMVLLAIWLLQIVVSDTLYAFTHSQWVYLGSQLIVLLVAFLLAWVYLSNTLEPAALSVKLSLGGMVCVLGVLVAINPLILATHIETLPIRQRLETFELKSLQQILVATPNPDPAIIAKQFPELQYIRVGLTGGGPKTLLFARDPNLTLETIQATSTDVSPLSGQPTFYQHHVPIGINTYDTGFFYIDTHSYSYQEALIALALYLAATIVGLMFFPIIFRATLLRPLNTLLRGVRQVNAGDLTANVPVHFQDEIGTVTQSFNTMVASLAEYNTHLEDLVRQRTRELEDANREIHSLNSRLSEENQRMSAELAVTRRLQEMILPREYELHHVPGLEVAGYMEPASEVGGDYYDVLQSGDRVKIGIGDVTGHGLESGVVMIMVQTAVRALLANHETDPSRFLDALNHAIYGNIERMRSDKNLSLVLLDYCSGRLRISGQHEEVIIVRADGTLEVTDTINLGFPIGLEEDIALFIGSIDLILQPNDVVVLYTDGVTEAEGPDRTLYGLDRLCASVVVHHHGSAEEIRTAIIADLKAFIGTGKIYDDITLVVLKQTSPVLQTLDSPFLCTPVLIAAPV